MSRPSHTEASSQRVARAADAFHAHLDECERCRTQPFNLCAAGEQLIREFGDANRERGGAR